MNTDFRRVIVTTRASQTALMSIPPGGEVGTEMHPHVKQTFHIDRGTGLMLIDGESSNVRSGDVVVVHPGQTHNLVNTGPGRLDLTTVYEPPNHIPGRVHRTKADADADIEDEQFGNRVGHLMPWWSW